MSTNSLIVLLIIGAVAGWLAGLIMKGGGYGVIWNIVIGIVGSFLGGWIFSRLNFSIGSGIIGSIITATIGAVVLLAVARALKRA